MTTSAERKLEYHPATGDLYFIGEAAHGLWKYGAGNGTFFWYCSMGDQDTQWSGDSELWPTVVRSEQMNNPVDIAALGLTGTPYADSSLYNVIRIYPIYGKTKVWRNSVEGQIAEGDYEELPWAEINAGRYFFYHQKSNNTTAVAIQLTELEDPPGVAAGQKDLHNNDCPSRSGYKSRCDGYLIDLALTTSLTFQSNAYNDLRTVVDPDDDSTIIVTPGTFDY